MSGFCWGPGHWQDVLEKDHFYEHLALGQGDLFGEVLDRHRSNAHCCQVAGAITGQHMHKTLQVGRLRGKALLEAAGPGQSTHVAR